MRYLKWHAKELWTDKARAERYNSIAGKFLSSVISFFLEGVRSTRQYLRLLGFLTIIKELSTTNDSKNEGPASRLLSKIATILYRAFIVLDNIVVLSRLGFIP